MSTGVDKILQQMGGSPEKNKTGVDKILEILENGGGGGLPEYTSADAGKVLTVNEDSDGVEWEAAGGGYDAEFTIYHSNSSADDYVCTRVSGDFATLTSMYESHTTPVILVRVEDLLNNLKTATTNVALYGKSADYLNLFAQVTKAIFNPDDIPFQTYPYIHWNNDDTITMS